MNNYCIITGERRQGKSYLAYQMTKLIKKLEKQKEFNEKKLSFYLTTKNYLPNEIIKHICDFVYLPEIF